MLRRAARLDRMLLSTSLGIAHYPEHGEDMKSLIQTADSTMYRVKKQGKCDVQVAI